MNQNEIELITETNEMYAKLIVPTQSSGASFSSTSGQIRSDNFAVGKSKGTVSEEAYEDYVSRLSIYQDHIAIGLILEKASHALPKGKAKRGSEPDRTLRIATDNITEVREDLVENFPGLVFETGDNVYQIKFANSENTFKVTNIDDSLITEAASMIENNMGGVSFDSESESESDDKIEKLNQLADLHEQGKLSDEEFKKAKQDLLN